MKIKITNFQNTETQKIALFMFPKMKNYKCKQ